MTETIEQWLRNDADNHFTAHAMSNGTVVVTLFWGGTDPDSGAPRHHCIGGGATVAEAFGDAWGAVNREAGKA